MKRIILIAACLLPVVVMAQRKFTIKGKIDHPNTPAKAFLYYGPRTNQIVDSANIVAGKFLFKGSIEGVSQAAIRIQHDTTAASREVGTDILPFYLEGKTMKVISASDSVKNAVIKRSKLNRDNDKFKKLIKSVSEKDRALMDEYYSKTPEERKDPAYLQTVYSRDEVIRKEMAGLSRQYYTAHLHSYIGLMVFKGVMNVEADLDGTTTEFNKFSAKLKATDLGKSIEKEIARVKGTGLGRLAMDFTQNDVNDKPVKLSDFRGQYVLLDFWASWCGPCRAENPNVVRAYNTYKDKNFTVLGVSLDYPGKKEDWLRAIEKDGLTWTQLSDLKGWQNEVSMMYGVRGIPANFLIDPSGKVIAQNVRGEALHRKLEEILGAQAK